MRPVRVLSVVSEIYPIIKTGGLADVAGALPNALKENDVETRTLIPGYPQVLEALEGAVPVFEKHLFGGMARLLRGKAAELDLFVLDAPHLFARHGNPYLSPDGTDWSDNGLRFGALSQIASNIGIGAVPSFVPAVIHCHDWQAALTPAYLHYGGQTWPRTVLTIHNLAFQGVFAREILDTLSLPSESFAVEGVEYYGTVGFLKAGLQFADRITTVSPTYAKEIQTDSDGMGLGGLLRARSPHLSGITNGIDTAVWNPETDRRISCFFGSNRLDERYGNKAALQRRLGLTEDRNRFLLGVISRLSWQKGLDVLASCIPTLLHEGIQLVLLGSGDAELENQFRAASRSYPDSVGVLLGYDEDLAHQIQAGADAIVVPSRFEPCGLTQLCALRYGAIPIVSRAGGLEDTSSTSRKAAQ